MTMLFDTDEMTGTAVISPCGLYRYRLGRVWDDALSPCVFVMLNPSTADASAPDPTVTRCIGFARALDCGGIVVVNLFAYRTKDPKVMAAAADPIGPENDEHIREVVTGRRGPVICAWGAGASKGRLASRVPAVLSLLHLAGVVPTALRVTKSGHPEHPLYLPSACRPIPWGVKAP